MPEQQEMTLPEMTGQVTTVTLPEGYELPAELQEQGAVLTPGMIDDTIERLREARNRPDVADEDRVYFMPTWTMQGEPALAVQPAGANPYTREPRGIQWTDYAQPVTIGQPNQPGELERSRSGDPIVECDLNGGVLSQRELDYIHNQICAAMMKYPGESLDIHIRRVNTAVWPRLIADTGCIYELLVKMVDKAEGAGRDPADLL